MSPLEFYNPTTEGPEYSNTAETQEKDLKNQLYEDDRCL